MYIYIYIYICNPKGGRHYPRCFSSSVKALLVKCPSVQRQPDGLTIRTRKWFLGAGFLGAPPICIIMCYIIISSKQSIIIIIIIIHRSTSHLSSLRPTTEAFANEPSSTIGPSEDTSSACARARAILYCTIPYHTIQYNTMIYYAILYYVVILYRAHVRARPPARAHARTYAPARPHEHARERADSE